MKALDLLPDGTFVIRDGVREWRARRPTIGEWRVIVELVEAADAKAAAVEAIPDEAAKTAARRDFIYGTADEPNPYLSAMAHALSILGAETSPDELPVWCAQAGPLQKILPHWRAVPLVLSWDETTSPELETTVEVS